MGLKQIFIFILFIVVISPFFFQKQKISEYKNIKLPYITIDNGKLKTYEPYLKKTGLFLKLDFYNQNNYILHNLHLNLLDKNATLDSYKVVFNNIYFLYNNVYQEPKYTYLSKYSIYNQKTKTLKSKQFQFFNKKNTIYGSGINMIYKNDIISAENIFYNIKDLK